MWMSSPMPMVTLVKTLDVSRLVKVSKKSGMKFTVLMCWCVGKAASQVDEFYTLPINGKLYRYDRLAINVIVENSKGGISSCDIPFSDDIQQFNRDYLSLTAQAANECKSSCFASDQRSSGGGKVGYFQPHGFTPIRQENGGKSSNLLYLHTPYSFTTCTTCKLSLRNLNKIKNYETVIIYLFIECGNRCMRRTEACRQRE